MALGDIVTMPLPTEWGPEIVPAVSGGVPGPFSRGIPQTLNVPAPVVGQPPAGKETTPWLVLPDSLLPAPLQLSNPLLRRTQFLPNRWDIAIARRAWLWQWIAEHGGLQSCCRIPRLGAPVYDIPPWQQMPSTGMELNKMFALSTDQVSGGPPYNGVDTLIGEFMVPHGWDGVVNRVVFGFTGNGFVDFSGSIVWRLKAGIRYAKDLGNVVNTFTNFQTALLIPGTRNVRLVSAQTVKILAAIPNGSPVAGGNVTGGVFGWVYPRR